MVSNVRFRSDSFSFGALCSGEFAGYDETQPTAESGGKGRVICMLKEKYGFEKVVMIGDGATDLEACPPAVSILFFIHVTN